ncbi:MAG: RDD family protein [Candidatus Brocadiia bacterium]
MGRRIPILIAASLALAAGVPRAAGADLLDQLLGRYVHPTAVAGPEALHLLYQLKADPQQAPSSCYRRLGPERQWSPEKRLGGAHLAAAFHDGALYVFRRTNYTTYRDSDWKPHAWALDWPPASACTFADGLWVFGQDTEEEAHRIRVARFQRPEAEDAAAARPVALQAVLPVSSRPYDLEAVPHEDAVQVFWHQDLPGEVANELWRATFDGQQWGEPQRVPAPYAHGDFAAVSHQGTLWVLCRERGRRLSDRRPVLAMTLGAEGWSEGTAVPGAEDDFLDFYTLDMGAASFQGSLYLFRATMNRVAVHRWEDGAWASPRMVTEVPASVIYGFWWSLFNAAACLALLPAVAWSAFRVRHRSRRLVLGDRVVARAAPWGRRVMALLVDFLMVEGLCSAAEVLLGAGGGDEGGLLPAVLLRAVVFFGYYVLNERLTGQTLGKWVLGIAVVSRRGARPSLGAVAVRNLLRPWLPLFPAAYLVGSMVLLLTPRHQRLGDLLARTLVVEVPRRSAQAEQSTEA